MPKIQWNESMSVGVPLFDQHHQKLFDIFNELTDHMDKGKGKAVIYQTLDELLEYAKYHFEAEEQFMLKNFCPSYRRHKNEHDDFLIKIRALFEKCKKIYSVNAIVELAMFLKDWIIGHMLKEDKEYSKYYKA